MASAVCVIANAVWVNSSPAPLPDDPPPDTFCATVVFVGGTFADVGIACGPFIACTEDGNHNPISDTVANIMKVIIKMTIRIPYP